MIQFCIFGGQGGTLTPGRRLYVTVCGGSDIVRLPLASKLADWRGNGRDDPGPSGQYFFLTLFGGAAVQWPPLAAEFLALRDALRSGAITWQDWDRAARSAGGLRESFPALTLFGSFDPDEVPEEDTELEALSIQRHNGAIPQVAIEHLMLAIGQAGTQRLAAVRQAVAAALAADA